MVRVEDVTLKWEYAEQLLKERRVPFYCLQKIFNKAVLRLEEKIFLRVEDGIKERAWEHFSKQKLPLFEKRYIEALCLDDSQIYIRLFSEAVHQDALQSLYQNGPHFSQREEACRHLDLTVPEQTLEEFFKTSIATFERHSRKTFSLALKQRVWNSFAPDKLFFLKQVYIDAYFDHVPNLKLDSQEWVLTKAREWIPDITRTLRQEGAI